MPLSTWTESNDNRSNIVDDYAYPASYAAVTALLHGLDDHEVAEVVGGAVRGDSAYDPPDVHLRANHGRTDWRRFLDLVETRGHAKDAENVMRTWVLTGDQRSKLKERSKARKGYAQLDAADGDWLPPLGLRSAMTSWKFGVAERLTDRLEALAGKAAAVQDAAHSSGVPVPEAVQTAYESADDRDGYSSLKTMLPHTVEAIGRVAESTSVAGADRNPVAELGAVALGIDSSAFEARAHLDAGDLDTADALARQTTDRAPYTLVVGIGLVTLGLVLLAALVLTARWAVGGPRDRR